MCLKSGLLASARLLLAAVSAGLAGVAIGVPASQGQLYLGPTPPPLAYPVAQQLLKDPALLSQKRAQWPQGTSQVAPQPAASGAWVSGTRPSGNPNLSNPLLLTDGTVIAHVSCTGIWWKLTPDIFGNYTIGTWSQIASLPSGYTPRFFSSAVLPDGRVIIEGGEYNTNCAAQWTNKGAIYDPIANVWTPVSPPSGWSQIGDAQATVLANGTYMQSDCCDTPAKSALLDPGSLTWTAAGTGKFDVYDEEGWTLLPDGTVLTVDAYVLTGTCGQGSERYNPTSGAWTSAGNTGIQLSDCANPGNKPSYELGPQVLRSNGTVVAFSGTTCSDVANTSCSRGALTVTSGTAIFNTNGNSWGVGPNIPAVNGQNYTLADAPATLLPNGNVLFAASPNYQAFATPTNFFEFSTGNTISQVASPTDAGSFTSFEWNFLVLPTGQIMALETDGPNVWYYQYSGGVESAQIPIVSALSDYTLLPGSTYEIAGNQLNGISQGAAYGDDVQSATNYPIVVIVNNATGHVSFARTFGFSYMGVAPNANSTALFTVPSGTELGPSILLACTNGVCGGSVVTLGNNGTLALSVSLAGFGTVRSSPDGINCPITCSGNFANGTTVTLSAIPATGWTFGGWGGAFGSDGCFGYGNCTVSMTSNQSVFAVFSTNGVFLPSGVSASPANGLGNGASLAVE